MINTSFWEVCDIYLPYSTYTVQGMPKVEQDIIGYVQKRHRLQRWAEGGRGRGGCVREMNEQG